MYIFLFPDKISICFSSYKNTPHIGFKEMGTRATRVKGREEAHKRCEASINPWKVKLQGAYVQTKKRKYSLGGRKFRVETRRVLDSQSSLGIRQTICN